MLLLYCLYFFFLSNVFSTTKLTKNLPARTKKRMQSKMCTFVHELKFRVISNIFFFNLHALFMLHFFSLSNIQGGFNWNTCPLLTRQAGLTSCEIELASFSRWIFNIELGGRRGVVVWHLPRRVTAIDESGYGSSPWRPSTSIRTPTL